MASEAGFIVDYRLPISNINCNAAIKDRISYNQKNAL